MLGCGRAVAGAVASAAQPLQHSSLQWRLRGPEAPERAFGVGHSTISEKSSPCLSEGTILTRMVPDLAKWQIRVGGVLLFGASERHVKHPGVDVDDPMCPKPKPGALRDGQIAPFYVKWQNLTVPMCSILGHGHHRIVQIDPRVVQGPFRCSEKQHTSHTDLPCGKIGHHMGQNGALA